MIDYHVFSHEQKISRRKAESLFWEICKKTAILIVAFLALGAIYLLLAAFWGPFPYLPFFLGPWRWLILSASG